MDALTARYRSRLGALTRRTTAELLVLWASWDPEDSATWNRFALPAIVLIQNRQREAASIGATYYRDMRRKKLGAAPRQPTLPATVRAGHVAASLSVVGLAGTYIGVRLGRTHVEAKRVAFKRVSGSATRHVMMGARQAVLAASKEDQAGIGWVRRTAGTCDWCKERAAEGVGTGTFHGHDHCKCVPEPVFMKPAPPALSRERFDKLWDRAMSKLDDTARAAQQEYTLRATQIFNAPLRAGVMSPDIAALDRAFTTGSSTLRAEATLYRGVDPVAVEHLGLKPGTVFEDAAFTSTSVDPTVAAKFADHVIEIRASAGTRVLPGSQYEAELILQRGSRFRVLETRSGRTVVELI